MKTRRPRNGSKWLQGKYNPTHPEKYKGTFPIVYRSSLELKFMKFADFNPGIVQWGSESVIVNYLDQTRKNRNNQPTVHRYYVDFNIQAKQKDGCIQKFLVEIKPFGQTQPPQKGRKKEKTFLTEAVTYIRNKCKWEAASAAAEKTGSKFIIITEKDLPS